MEKINSCQGVKYHIFLSLSFGSIKTTEAIVIENNLWKVFGSLIYVWVMLDINLFQQRSNRVGSGQITLSEVKQGQASYGISCQVRSGQGRAGMSCEVMPDSGHINSLQLSSG